MKNIVKKVISIATFTAVATISINAGAGTINKYGQFDSSAQITKVSADGYYSSDAARMDQILHGNGTCGFGC